MRPSQCAAAILHTRVSGAISAGVRNTSARPFQRPQIRLDQGQRMEANCKLANRLFLSKRGRPLEARKRRSLIIRSREGRAEIARRFSACLTAFFAQDARAGAAPGAGALTQAFFAVITHPTWAAPTRTRPAMQSAVKA